MLRIAAAVVLGLYGLLHVTGFIAAWQLASFTFLPYDTALLFDLWNVGEAGVRLFGALYLLTALAFIAAGLTLVSGNGLWRWFTSGALLLSLFLTVVYLPDSFIGLLLNGLFAFGLIVQASLTARSGSSS